MMLRASALLIIVTLIATAGTQGLITLFRPPAAKASPTYDESHRLGSGAIDAFRIMNGTTR
jgi:hypothetical protein